MTGPTRTLNEEQAYARVETHLRQAIAQVDPTGKVETGMRITIPCDDPTDEGPPGRVFVEAHYWLRGIPASRNRAVFDTLFAFWTASGCDVISDQRALREAPQLKVLNREDSFVMVLRQNLAEELELLASSHCIWPEGTPPDALSGESGH